MSIIVNVTISLVAGRGSYFGPSLAIIGTRPESGIIELQTRLIQNELLFPCRWKSALNSSVTALRRQFGDSLLPFGEIIFTLTKPFLFGSEPHP